MSSIVSNLVSASLRNHGASSYEGAAAPVVADLQRALDGAVSTIVEEGTRLGASEEQVKSILVQAGLLEPEPKPEPVQADSGSDAQGLLERLVAFAQAHGFRG